MSGFEVTIDATRAVAKFEEFPPALATRLGVHVERFLIYLQSYIVANKLSGSPLHRRSGNLSASINTNGPNMTDSSVSGTVGTNLAYGRVHEVGGTFDIREHLRRVTMVFGRTLAKPVMASVRSHSATYPERSFLRSALQESSDQFLEEVQAAVNEAAGAA